MANVKEDLNIYPEIQAGLKKGEAFVKKAVQRALVQMSKLHEEETKKRTPERTGKTAESIKSVVDKKANKIYTVVHYNHPVPLNIPALINVLTVSKTGKAYARRAEKSARVNRKVGKQYAMRAVTEERQKYIDIIRRQFK